MLYRLLLQLFPLFIAVEPGTDDKTQPSGPLQRKLAARAGYGIERQMRVFPVLELAQAHVKRYSANPTQFDVCAAQIELSIRIAHRCAAIAAAAGLMKHEFAVLGLQFINQRERGFCRRYACNNCIHKANSIKTNLLK